MTIKELFKQMEKANEFATLVGDEERFEMEVAICQEQYFDWYFAISFKTFKDFQKHCKEEYDLYYRDAFYNADIQMGDDGNGEGYFIIENWGRKCQEHHIIKVHIYRTK